MYFHYSSMNAEKSTALLQAHHNYGERGMNTLLLTAYLDDRHGKGVIRSRIGIEQDAKTFRKGDNLLILVRDQSKAAKLACVLIDEAQFLKKGTSSTTYRSCR